MTAALSPLQKIVLDALVASGWSHAGVSAQDPLVDLGFDSLALALWIAELERKCQVRFPAAELAMEKWSTLADAAKILEPLLQRQNAGQKP